MIATPLLVVALAATAQAPAASKPWEVVVSKEGNFTVEMPARPNMSRSMTRSSQGLRYKLAIVACETKRGSYIAQKVEFSEPIAKGVEETLHDALRNSLAEDLKGKVTSEKKVSLLGRPGRDFTIRGQPEPKSVLTIRVRQFMLPNAIFQLYVVSEPNRTLPDDAGKFLGSFAPGLHPEGTTKTADASAAAMAGREIPGWGSAVDPNGDCTIEPAGSALSVKVPGSMHDFNADTGDFNSPRVVRDVGGDFTATVKVDGSFNPGPRGVTPKAVPVNAGGLFVWRDPQNYIRLERMIMFKNGRLHSFINFEEREGGHRGAMHNVALPSGTVYLRLQRKGNQITAAVSQDGETYDRLRPIDTTWPSKLKVGLLAINSCADPMTVTFDKFNIKSARP